MAPCDPESAVSTAKTVNALGVIAIACYCVQAGTHLGRGEPQDVLWACHIAALLVGVGLLMGSATLNAIGLLWSCFGTPLWILYLATGGDLIAASFFTHGAALILGTIGVRRLGMPRGAAWKATAAFTLLWIATRALTPRWANVNLAFSVYDGWEAWFPSYPIYLAMLLVLGFAGLCLAEYLFALVARRQRAA
jgi:hypothetical protein